MDNLKKYNYQKNKGSKGTLKLEIDKGQKFMKQVNKILTIHPAAKIFAYEIGVKELTNLEDSYWKYSEVYVNGRTDVLSHFTMPATIFTSTTCYKTNFEPSNNPIKDIFGRILLLATEEAKVMKLRKHLENSVVCIRPHPGIMLPYQLTTFNKVGVKIVSKINETIPVNIANSLYKSGVVLPVYLKPCAQLINGEFQRMEAIVPTPPTLLPLIVPDQIDPALGARVSYDLFENSMVKGCLFMRKEVIKDLKKYRNLVNAVLAFDGIGQHDAKYFRASADCYRNVAVHLQKLAENIRASKNTLRDDYDDVADLIDVAGAIKDIRNNLQADGDLQVVAYKFQARYSFQTISRWIQDISDTLKIIRNDLKEISTCLQVIMDDLQLVGDSVRVVGDNFRVDGDNIRADDDLQDVADNIQVIVKKVRVFANFLGAHANNFQVDKDLVDVADRIKVFDDTLRTNSDFEVIADNIKVVAGNIRAFAHDLKVFVDEILVIDENLRAFANNLRADDDLLRIADDFKDITVDLTAVAKKLQADDDNLKSGDDNKLKSGDDLLRIADDLEDITVDLTAIAKKLQADDDNLKSGDDNKLESGDDLLRIADDLEDISVDLTAVAKKLQADDNKLESGDDLLRIADDLEDITVDLTAVAKKLQADDNKLNIKVVAGNIRAFANDLEVIVVKIQAIAVNLRAFANNLRADDDLEVTVDDLTAVADNLKSANDKLKKK